MTRVRLNIIGLYFFCFSVMYSVQTNTTASELLWQKEFSYQGFSCCPQLLDITPNGHLVVVGTMLDMQSQHHQDVKGRIWQWMIDKDGKRLDDLTLKEAAPKDCEAIRTFWPAKGIDVFGDTKVLIDDFDHVGKQVLIQRRQNNGINKKEIGIRDQGRGIFAARLKRLDQNAYVVVGSDTHNGQAIVQKRDNDDSIIWEKRYQFGTRDRATSIDKYPGTGLFAVAGFSTTHNDPGGSVWLRLLDGDGNIVAKDVFDTTSIDLILTPSVVVLDNNNMALIYSDRAKGPRFTIHFRIYSASLELECQKIVYTSTEDAVIFYGVCPMQNGFSVVHNVERQDSVAYLQVHQYNSNGDEFQSIRIDNMNAFDDKILIKHRGNIIYIAGYKPPVLPPLKTVISAINLGDSVLKQQDQAQK